MENTEMRRKRDGPEDAPEDNNERVPPVDR